MQLPAWNEALGLPRPFDQQWSLRMQQIMAYETDLLEFGDLFDGSGEVTRKVEVLARLNGEGLADIPVVVGGIIPPEDEKLLRAEGVAAIYTPKNFEINAIMSDIVRIVDEAPLAAD